MSASVVLVIVHRAPPSSWLQFNHDLSFAQGLYHESFAVEDQCAGTSYYCSVFTSSSNWVPFSLFIHILFWLVPRRALYEWIRRSMETRSPSCWARWHMTMI